MAAIVPTLPSFMKRIFKWLLFASGLFFLLWLFNPTEHQFIRHFAKERGSVNPKDTVSYIEEHEIYMAIQNGELNYDLDHQLVYNYKSYLLFSLGTRVDDKNHSCREVRYSYIGILGNIYFLNTKRYTSY